MRTSSERYEYQQWMHSQGHDQKLQNNIPYPYAINALLWSENKIVELQAPKVDENNRTLVVQKRSLRGKVISHALLEDCSGPMCTQLFGVRIGNCSHEVAFRIEASQDDVTTTSGRTPIPRHELT